MADRVNMFRLSVAFLVLILGLAGIALPLSAQPAMPKLEARVSDFTNTLSYAEWRSLEKLLKDFEDSSSTQIVVVIMKSLEGAEIGEFAPKLFEVNRIGQAKKNNGVLLLIAKEDRKVKIEVGYGLEGVLTDALTSQIIAREIVPKFRQENYFAGIVGGVDAIMRASAGEYKSDQRGRAAPAISGALVVAAFLFFFFILVPLAASRRRTSIGSGGHRYFSGWGYGGGWPGSFGGGGFSSGGGGFGGFSGGGGMSGGGGASGSW